MNRPPFIKAWFALQYGVSNLVRTHEKGRGVKQKRTPCIQEGRKVDTPKCVRKRVTFCMHFVIFSYVK